MAITVLFEGTVAKHSESPEENEDACRLAPDRGRVVLSDGASESFDARSWARLLVDRVIEEELTLDVVAECAEAYARLHDPASMSWSRAAAYERGSFATLLVAQDYPESRMVRVAASGDSLALWVDGGEVLASFPYDRSELFQEKPVLLATRTNLNSSQSPAWATCEWPYDEQGYRFLLCMTDALGAWLLAHQERGDTSALERLLSIREPGELRELVDQERIAGRMRRDDTTLVIASVTQG